MILSGFIYSEFYSSKMILKINILPVFLIFEISKAMDHSECYRRHSDIRDPASNYGYWFPDDTRQPVRLNVWYYQMCQKSVTKTLNVSMIGYHHHKLWWSVLSSRHQNRCNYQFESKLFLYPDVQAITLIIVSTIILLHLPYDIEVLLNMRP